MNAGEGKAEGWVQSGAFFGKDTDRASAFCPRTTPTIICQSLQGTKTRAQYLWQMMPAAFVVEGSPVQMRQTHHHLTYTSIMKGFSCACMHTNPVANSISPLQEQQQELWRSSSPHPSRVHLQTSHVDLCYPS